MTIDEIISQLTLEEKALLLQGDTVWTTLAIARLGIPAIFLSDGPHGVRKQAGAGDHLGLNASLPATCFPTAATMANSWDTELGEQMGAALGNEAAALGVNVLLGPGLNIKRSPLCGRNFEYFSEDPYLAGKMAAAYIRGIQSQGVGACPKHFAVNSQETRRMCMDSAADERTLREIYLTGFEIAVKEGHPRTLMSSYNQINGCYANENDHLLTDILRNEWGFDGFVVTDWGGDNNHTQGVRAGSELVMPAPGMDTAIGLVADVRNGKIDESILDDRLRKLLTQVFALHENSKQYPSAFDQNDHHALARKCAADSIVLLENDGTLPLSSGTKVALIGDFAIKPRYQGAGSSVVNPTKLEDLSACITRSGLNVVGVAQGYVRTGVKAKEDLTADAVTLARQADVVLLCIGLDEISESEGLDRTHLEIPHAQKELLHSLQGTGAKVVLVLSGGASFIMPETNQYCAAIHGYLGGQAGAAAMTDTLVGKISPSGKLAESWPMSLSDTPANRYFPAKERTSEYREGLFVGYRYYDTAEIAVRYPFGHGLSYTPFAYSDIHATTEAVTFTITNTGRREGKEVAQLYVHCSNGKVFRPKKELKGFVKVSLAPGEKKIVSIPLDDKAFRYYNRKTKCWEIETGNYQLLVAASAADVRLIADLHVQGTDAPLPYEKLPSYQSGNIADVPNWEFVHLLGHPIPDGQWRSEIEINDALCQLSHAKGATAHLVNFILTRMIQRADATGVPDLNALFLYNMPVRSLANMSFGWVTRDMAQDILLMFNGHFFRGIGRLVIDFFRGIIAKRKLLKTVQKAGH